ncbi:MAG: DUF5916 domain-containing protein [candidate division Zixibacteria bacterium]|nr:DUF5916 domain-containing protein [candidate division Zixibacteria bacterium]
MAAKTPYAILRLTAAISIVMVMAVTAEAYQPVYRPTLVVSKAAGEVVIDGDLGDAGWRGTMRVGGFAEHFPGDQTEPPVKTEAMLTHDDRYLYAAFVCYDDPKTLRATYAERDDIYDDDNVVLLLDTYGDAAWAYEFTVNPYGIQGDVIWSRSGDEDTGYDFIWTSSALITDSGYQVEMAIPFSSLRFPNNDAQTWRVDFWRNHPRASRRQYSWAAYDRNEPCWPCKWGTVTGISGVKGGRGWEFLPSMIGYQKGELEGEDKSDRIFKNDDPDGEFSLGAKYTIGPDMTTEITFNPDFSQVESDAAQIEVNTTNALFYSERRPFFQEGSDLFDTRLGAVYTRMINSPQVAAKLTGRPGRTNIAFLVARDDRSPVILPFAESSEYVLGNKSVSEIMRLRRTFGEDSYLGIAATDRRFDGGGSGTFASFDGGVRLLKNYRLEWQAAKSFTHEPDDTMLTSEIRNIRFDNGDHTAAFDGEEFSGHAFFGRLEREGRHLSAELIYTERSPAYRADLGFDTNNNRRQAEASAEYTFFVNSGIMDRLFVEFTAARVWNFDGCRQDEWAWLDLAGQFKGQTYVSVSYMRSRERFRDLYFPEIMRVDIEAESIFSHWMQFGFEITQGHTIARRQNPPIMGNETYLSVWGTFKPIERLRIEPDLEFNKSDKRHTGEILYRGYITRWRTSYQLTRELSLRLIVQYDDFDHDWQLDPLVSFRLNPLSVFYMGSTYDYREFRNDLPPGSEWRLKSRQLFFKMQYLIQM